jgi:hypothetical protein
MDVDTTAPSVDDDVNLMLFDPDHRRWTAVAQSGKWGPAVYIALCSLRATLEGWFGSRRMLRDHIAETIGSTRPKPSYKSVNNAVQQLCDKGILRIEKRGQMGIFTITNPYDNGC